MSREGRKLKGTIYTVAKTYSKERKLYEALNLNPKIFDNYKRITNLVREQSSAR